MKLTYDTWKVETVNVQIDGENLVCGHYSKTAPLNVYYRSQDMCGSFKTCQYTGSPANSTHCTYKCTCKNGNCGSVYLVFNHPGDEVFCDAHFFGQY